MRPKVIPRAVVVTAISQALKQFATDLGDTLPVPLERAATDACKLRLQHMLQPQETLLLLRIVAEMRIECAGCRLGVPYTSASGAYCLSCAKQRAAEAEPYA